MDFHAFLEKLRALPDKQKKAILWTTVGILAVIMGGFWINGLANRFSKLSFGELQIPQIEIPNLNIPSDEPNDDWKTYKNEDWGIEFKYPSNLGVPEVDSYTNTLSFVNDKTKILFLRKTTSEDIQKCEQECEKCQRENTCQLCMPCQNYDFLQKQKDFIEKNEVGAVECNSYNTHPSKDCEIKVIGDIKMLFEHDVWTPGGPVDSRYFYKSDVFFDFLPYDQYVGDIFNEYGTNETAIISTFKFTK